MWFYLEGMFYFKMLKLSSVLIIPLIIAVSKIFKGICSFQKFFRHLICILCFLCIIFHIIISFIAEIRAYILKISVTIWRKPLVPLIFESVSTLKVRCSGGVLNVLYCTRSWHHLWDIASKYLKCQMLKNFSVCWQSLISLTLASVWKDWV